MNVLKSVKTSMKVYKPYTLKQSSSSRLQGAKSEGEGEEDRASGEVSANPTAAIIPATVVIPSPPPENIYLYRIVAGPQNAKALAQVQAANGGTPPPPPATPGAPTVTVTAAAASTSTPSKKKPRTIHEYYDQHLFQWREFNPEDTIVGDASDPFIVYLRYASKSIGARRTPWILPKHIKLIKIMQDCLPDFDWRTGEDLLLKARILYLRRKVLEEAVEKLKRGEPIGPVTKAAMEGKDEDEDKEDETSAVTENDKSPQNTPENSTVVKENDPSKLTSSTKPEPASNEPAEMSSDETQTTTSASGRGTDGEDSSDTNSNDSDFPPTPFDEATEIPESSTVDLVEENIREAKEMRKSSGPVLSAEASEKFQGTEDSSKSRKVQAEIKVKDKKVKDKEKKRKEDKVEVVVPEKPKPERELEGWEMLQMVVTWIRKEFLADEKALARQLANKEISYRFLWLYYTPGTLVSLEDPVSKQKVGARIELCEYLPQSTIHPPRLELLTKIIDANGEDFIYSNLSAHIKEYDAAKLIDELPVQILTPEMPLYKTLQERGRKFVGLNGVHYMQLDGILVINRGNNIIRSKTRVMVDCKAFRESNPSYAHSFNGISVVDFLGNPIHPPHLTRFGLPGLHPPIPPAGMPGPITIKAAPKDIKKVPEEELILCSPTVFGYAFTEKAWVQMTVDGISDVVWDTEAYDKLVLPDDTKKLVKSLVQACRTETKLIKDIISTKGSGVVFVLHGDPGTGKTLTAEAIGEELRRPILVIAVSDLGTDPTNVEIRLGNFLRTAEKWDSIVLLDEADIFLEQRGRMDIFRNAMVGVFLRLLEYHNSPMFLTTNRVFAFDPAIRSRISIAIKYHPLKRAARKQVWQQLLDMANAKVSPCDLTELAMSSVNGREIKNTIRSAQALAVADGTELMMKHIKTVLDVQREFREDFEGLPGTWNGMGVS